MAYNSPPQNNIPFRFTTGGYQAPDFGQIALNFNTRTAQTAVLGAAITGVYGHYQYDTYTYLKYCDRYVVGYSSYGVQIMKGKCYYGGIRDIGAIITGLISSADLGGYIKVLVSDQADLGAEIASAALYMDLPAIIGAHYPGDLPGSIHAWDIKDLPGYINQIYKNDLPAIIGGHLPGDLPAYLNVWPQEDLPGSIHGWQIADLQAYINALEYKDLPAIIGAHQPENIKGIIKGWVREATYDLGATTHGYDAGDLPGIINIIFKEDLPAEIYGIPPRDLQGIIRGWQEADLGGIINGTPWPWDLPASVVGYPPEDLGAYINPIGWALSNYRDLSAYINTLRGVPVDLSAAMNVMQASDLSAFIDTGRGIGDLGATILPKRIRLTSVISVITMEHKDLSATISIPCFYSDYKDLMAYVRPVFIADLAAVIYPKGWVKGTKDLGALWGYAAEYAVVDKLPINVNIAALGFRTEDRQPITLTTLRSASFLAASIVGTYRTVDISAYVNGVEMTPVDFDNYKNRERVTELLRQLIQYDYQDVTIEFSDIVSDYYYSTSGEFSAKVNRREEWWITKIAGWYSPETSAKLSRKLHRVKHLYDMRRYTSVDQAIKAAIEYVTAYPSEDISAYINVTGEFKHLGAIVNGTTTVSTFESLSSTISGTLPHSYDVVIAYTDDGVGYLQFS